MEYLVTHFLRAKVSIALSGSSSALSILCLSYFVLIIPFSAFMMHNFTSKHEIPMRNMLIAEEEERDATIEV